MRELIANILFTWKVRMYQFWQFDISVVVLSNTQDMDTEVVKSISISWAIFFIRVVEIFVACFRF